MRCLRLDRRSTWTAAAVAVVLMGSCGNDDHSASTTSTTSSRLTTTTEATTTTTDSTSSTTTTTSSSLPAPSGVVARRGAGSGEVELEWSAVPGATGYRVLRSPSASGSFGVVAEIDVRNGATTTSPGVTNVWSDGHSYLPARGSLTAPDESGKFHLVNTESEARCFRVIALRDATAGTPSTTACSSPP